MANLSNRPDSPGSSSEGNTDKPPPTHTHSRLSPRAAYIWRVTRCFRLSHQVYPFVISGGRIKKKKRKNWPGFCFYPRRARLEPGGGGRRQGAGQAAEERTALPGGPEGRRPPRGGHGSARVRRPRYGYSEIWKGGGEVTRLFQRFHVVVIDSVF